MIKVIRDLRQSFGPARDQGQRPTCLAFATSDLHAFSRGGQFRNLSTEYIYYHACERDTPPTPNDGATTVAMRDAAEIDGQPEEGFWPYLAALPTDVSKWRPPKVQDVFRIKLKNASTTVQEVIGLLDKDTPTLLILRLTRNFLVPTKNAVVEDIAGDPPIALHAVVAVGHGELAQKRLILIRNSWGNGWGANGYAWVHEAYVSRNLQSTNFLL